LRLATGSNVIALACSHDKDLILWDFAKNKYVRKEFPPIQNVVYVEKDICILEMEGSGQGRFYYNVILVSLDELKTLKTIPIDSSSMRAGAKSCYSHKSEVGCIAGYNKGMLFTRDGKHVLLPLKFLAVDFSADGKRFATASLDALQIWLLETETDSFYTCSAKVKNYARQMNANGLNIKAIKNLSDVDIQFLKASGAVERLQSNENPGDTGKPMPR